MKTEYKHIHFEDVSYMYPGRKTRTFLCLNNMEDTPLGDIQWCAPWRQYCFYTRDSIILAISCLNDIGDFIKQINEDRERRHKL